MRWVFDPGVRGRGLRRCSRSRSRVLVGRCVGARGWHRWVCNAAVVSGSLVGLGLISSACSLVIGVLFRGGRRSACDGRRRRCHSRLRWHFRLRSTPRGDSSMRGYRCFAFLLLGRRRGRCWSWGPWMTVGACGWRACCRSFSRETRARRGLGDGLLIFFFGTGGVLYFPRSASALPGGRSG